MKVVAEGVDQIATSRTFKEMDCDFIQGYYYSKPLPSGRTCCISFELWEIA